jgi:hypothetical protein
MSERLLTTAEKGAVGTAWVEMGLGEHASIAAFAKLILELLAIGAPPYLLEGAARALCDEIEHCRLCFERAAEFNQIATSPGQLDLHNLSIDTDPAVILKNAITEGCFTETISAYWAVEAYASTTSSLEKDPLSRISSDEMRHSQFSWDLVKWLLSEFRHLREVATESFTQALADFESVSTKSAEASSVPPGYGHLDVSTRVRVAKQTVQDVIVPSRDRLLASAGDH